MAVYGACGLVVAAAAAGILAVIGSRALAASKALMSAAWITDAALATVAVLYLLVTLVAWLIYRRRRLDLDAAGAEFHARIANLHRDDTD